MLYEPQLHVVLYEPQIPPNTGNIGRTCVAAGAKLWMVKPLGFDISEKARRRAGLDYWEHLEWDVVEDWQAMSQHIAPQLASQRTWFFSKKATKLYTEVEFQTGDALVFGSETSGLPDAIHNDYDAQMLRVPMRTPVRSLNLSATAALVMYEALRQIYLNKPFNYD